MGAARKAPRLDPGQLNFKTGTKEASMGWGDAPLTRGERLGAAIYVLTMAGLAALSFYLAFFR